MADLLCTAPARRRRDCLTFIAVVKDVFPGGTEEGALSSVAMTKVLKLMGFGGVTVHGFRSMFRDWVAERTRYPREWAEIALEHRVGSATERTYFRSDLVGERRGLMEEWAAWCGSKSADGA